MAGPKTGHQDSYPLLPRFLYLYLINFLYFR